jgi:template-activating factor I
MASTAKKPKVDEENQRSVDEKESEALEQIDNFQGEIDALNEKASDEILKIEQKYNKLRKPFYEKRNEAIKKIPNFWLTAFINHPQISSILEEDEEECLHFLEAIDVEEFEDIRSGYRINFHFEENPFFTNKTLTKEFHLGTANGKEKEKEETTQPTSTNTKIEWKPDRNLLEQLEHQRASGKRKRNSDYKSFFAWFTDNNDPACDEVAELIKDDLWPNPLQYFLVPGDNDDIEVEGEEDLADEEIEEEELGDSDDEK